MSKLLQKSTCKNINICLIHYHKFIGNIFIVPFEKQGLGRTDCIEINILLKIWIHFLQGFLKIQEDSGAKRIVNYLNWKVIKISKLNIPVTLPPALQVCTNDIVNKVKFVCGFEARTRERIPSGRHGTARVLRHHFRLFPHAHTSAIIKSSLGAVSTLRYVRRCCGASRTCVRSLIYNTFASCLSLFVIGCYYIADE